MPDVTDATTDATAGLDFLVNKSDWQQHRFAATPVPALAPGQVLFRVDRFALTANNISYALAGDTLGYWRFFPAPAGWGRLPVMGFATAVASRHAAVVEGTRCFGFYPMSRYLVIEPAATDGASVITDGAAHRVGLSPFYNQYTPTTADALHAPAHEDALMLMRGLFMTAFLADDFLAEQNLGEQLLLISSASSKTAVALAHCVAARGANQSAAPPSPPPSPSPPRVVGLTSARNRAFVRGLGCYDEVVTYDETAALDASAPAVFVDMAGSRTLRRAVHEHFGARLRHSCAVGATHWEASGADDAALPGPKPAFFFAPAQGQKRSAEWGAREFQRRLAAAWAGFHAFSEGWLEIKRASGRRAVARAYTDTLTARTPPQVGQILSL